MGMWRAVLGGRAGAAARRPREALAGQAPTLLLIATVLGIVLGVVGMHGIVAEAHPAAGSAATTAVSHAAPAGPESSIGLGGAASSLAGSESPIGPGASASPPAAATAGQAPAAHHDVPGCGACAGHTDGDGGAALCLLALLAFGVALLVLLARRRGASRSIHASVRSRLLAALARIPRPPSLVALGISRT